MNVLESFEGLQVTGWATQSIYIHKVAAGPAARLLYTRCRVVRGLVYN